MPPISWTALHCELVFFLWLLFSFSRTFIFSLNCRRPRLNRDGTPKGHTWRRSSILDLTIGLRLSNSGCRRGRSTVGRGDQILDSRDLVCLPRLTRSAIQ